MDWELERYVENHASEEPEYLRAIERRSYLHLINGRMCSGRVQGRLLKMFVEMINPQRVLELGTFSGYSALSMAEGLSDGAVIDTIEADDELEDFISESVAMAPEHIGVKINLHIGDALEVMSALDVNSYDLIFIDADKRQYPAYYMKSMELLKPGGYIIADNTLWYGHVVESEYENDAQTRGIREFNDLVAGDSRVEQVILPVRDGLTLIHRF